MVFKRHFQQYFSYIVAISFINALWMAIKIWVFVMGENQKFMSSNILVVIIW
jgi:hypothetical protein